VLAYLLNRRATSASSATGAPRSEAWPGLERAKLHLEAHFDKRLTLAHLARIARCSPFHLIRAFRDAYRETPHRYQVRQRIDRAKVLLAESELSVTEICFAVGFESLGTFSSRFRSLSGWAPSVYRARVLAQRIQPRGFIPDCYVRQFHLTV